VSEETETIESFEGTMVVYEQEKALIDSQVATAKHYPRNVRRATENAIAIVTMDKETAATCTYSVPRGGKAITGPSVHLANILAQTWGHLRVDSKVVDIDSKHVTSEGMCYDLENNYAVKTTVKRKITNAQGKTFNDDMITVTGNAGNAIAKRNAIFSVIPKSVINRVYKAAQDMITGDISDATKLITRRKQVVDGLKDAFGVTEVEILKSIGKSSIDHIGAEELVVLIGYGQAIKDGDTTSESVFRPEKAGSKKDDQYKDIIDAAKVAEEKKK
jgi:hypothetical protein